MQIVCIFKQICDCWLRLYTKYRILDNHNWISSLWMHGKVNCEQSKKKIVLMSWNFFLYATNKEYHCQWMTVPSEFLVHRKVDRKCHLVWFVEWYTFRKSLVSDTLRHLDDMRHLFRKHLSEKTSNEHLCSMEFYKNK